MLRVAFAFVLLALLVAPAPALADAKSEARARMERATELHAQGKFQDALIELMTAYSLDPRPEVLYAIAQTHVALGNCPQAITFYERFLSTRPAAVPAAAAQEAIDTCKAGPVAPEPVAPTEPPADPALDPPTAPAPPPPRDRGTSPGPWYTDVLGDALVGGGVVCGVVAAFGYRAALGDLDDAEAATDYQQHVGLVDDARGKRTLATVFAVGGAALIGAGVVRFVLRSRRADDRGLALAPADGGRGVIAGWSGRF